MRDLAEAFSVDLHNRMVKQDVYIDERRPHTEVRHGEDMPIDTLVDYGMSKQNSYVFVHLFGCEGREPAVLFNVEFGETSVYRCELGKKDVDKFVGDVGLNLVFDSDEPVMVTRAPLSFRAKYRKKFGPQSYRSRRYSTYQLSSPDSIETIYKDIDYLMELFASLSES